MTRTVASPSSSTTSLLPPPLHPRQEPSRLDAVSHQHRIPFCWEDQAVLWGSEALLCCDGGYAWLERPSSRVSCLVRTVTVLSTGPYWVTQDRLTSCTARYSPPHPNCLTRTYPWLNCETLSRHYKFKISQ